ncbi:Aromatic-ring hydroxylase-like protein [Quillaja saponaria]|uniref:Aromatic-ring hydroxylase-like protein n=1 Tax=Quillaja saponaria TaxID=32244 RepID=A0AAD7KXB7_QUISA|nr:Aromatic-ring hydroxylase-like protein [Quillaja saponaria]
MVYQIIVVGVIAAALVVYNFYSMWRKNNNKASVMNHQDNQGVKTTKETENNQVIIVGAGVAGSALAYALGKIV